jgi:hypothetical protein
LHLDECRSKHRDYVTLKIDRIKARIRLSGELRSAQLDQVKAEVKRGKSKVALDLEEISLIDLDGVRFLNACEAHGIEIMHSPPYIKNWMEQERGRQKAGPKKLITRRIAEGDTRNEPKDK